MYLLWGNDGWNLANFAFMAFLAVSWTPRAKERAKFVFICISGRQKHHLIVVAFLLHEQ